MITNPVLEAIKSRRAVRSFENEPVPKALIQTILEAATYAPSGANIQPWKFTIITSKSEIKRFSDLTKSSLLRMLPDVGNEAISGLRQQLADPLFNIFHDAPLLIFVSGLKGSYDIYDCCMAAQTMMLAAYSLGIGSCFIGTAVGLARDREVKAELGVPEDHEVHAAVVFGYPKDGFPQAPPKYPPQILKRID